MNKKFKQLTPFQWQVLKAAMEIPMGQTRSYQWVAQKIGKPKAVGAIGSAHRNNPYPLMIPCHRVIKEDGNLGAYAGRYDHKKKALLDLEKKIAQALKVQ